MNIKRILIVTFPLTFAETLILILLLAMDGIQNGAAAPSGGPHHVANDCTGVPAPCYTTIQAAVDAADPGDLIQVAAGLYTDVHSRKKPAGYEAPVGFTMVSQVVYITQTLTIKGG